MLSTEALTIAAGISTFLGLIGFLAYLYFALVFNRAEASVSRLVGGNPLFTAEQVVKILSQFKDDEARLRALENLTKYDRTRTVDLLTKVKGNVNITLLNKVSSGHYRTLTLVAAVLFVAFGILAYFYSKSSGTDEAVAIKWTQEYPLAALPNNLECGCVKVDDNTKDGPLKAYYDIENTCKGRISLLAAKDGLPGIGARPNDMSIPHDPGQTYRTYPGRYWAAIEMRPTQKIRLDFSGFQGGFMSITSCPAS